MLKVSQLSFSFPFHRLFTDLNFDVEPGDLVHLCGTNGSGKSTLIKILAGLLAPSSGFMTALTPEFSDLEYLPSEANGLFLKLSALDNLKFWLNLRGIPFDEEHLTRNLEAWGVLHKAVHYGLSVEKFSTGMRRRLSLVRIALSPAKLWLLDEPLYGLDERAVQQFRRLLQEHLANQGAIVIVSHEKQILEGLITKTVNLSEGEQNLP